MLGACWGMITFVLVHGAYVGGWYWRWLTPHLRAAGYEVVVPTMTGLGERAHLATPEVSLETSGTSSLSTGSRICATQSWSATVTAA